MVMIFFISSCGPSIPDLTQESSYVNYNNYNKKNRSIEIQDDTLYMTYEDLHYVDSIFSVDKNGKREICNDVGTRSFVKNGNSIYYTDYERHLKRRDVSTGETFDVFNMVTYDLYLIYDDIIVVYNDGQLIMIDENGTNKCLLENPIFWVGANENGIYAVSYDSSVWKVNMSTLEAVKIGSFPKTSNYQFVVSNNYLTGYSTVDYKDIVSFNLNSGELKEYQAANTIQAINAGRNDVAYYMCYEESMYGETKKSKTNGLYSLDLTSGEINLIDKHAVTFAELYIYDDEWVYVLSEGNIWGILSTQELDRVAVDGSKRQHVYTDSVFN